MSRTLYILISFREKAPQSPRFELYRRDYLKDELLRTALRVQQVCLLSSEYIEFKLAFLIDLEDRKILLKLFKP